MDALKEAVENAKAKWLEFRDLARSSVTTRILGCAAVLVVFPILCLIFTVRMTYKLAKSVLVGK